MSKIIAQPGLKENAGQFWLLMLMTGFVGAMVGLERAVIPKFAETVFSLNGHTAILSFIVAFGLAKSVANLVMGQLSMHLTRRQLLLIGWLFALPVPWLLLYANSWWWVLAANLLLGINQGLAWTSSIVMTIDLVGEKNRGLAMGINEFAGYLAVGLASFLAGYIASATGEVTYAFVPGIAFSLAGVLLVLFVVHDTHAHVQAEAAISRVQLLSNVWKDTTWRHINLGPVTLNGFVTKINDGVLWGLLPMVLSSKGYSLVEIGFLAGIYPAVWGIGQLFTGKLGDTYSRKKLLCLGMLLQGMAIAALFFTNSYALMLLALAVVGVGTAMVYPTFLTLVADNTHPSQRSQSMGIFRFWRDFGYVGGAVAAGIFSDLFGAEVVLLGAGIGTIGAGVFSGIRMLEQPLDSSPLEPAKLKRHKALAETK
ncbi:MFS transporter [Pontibacter pamirensis]|uniref:MFS transporter n=1 Tax=Pontibacter pamirensis TaxID=2562824 RepID=UPI00138A1856|nr:MFS transporter [Pontibacter pamirensis]